MITVNLGVEIERYEGGEGKTTEDVAHELETQYGIVEYFVESHWDDIAKNVGQVIADKFYGGNERIPDAMANIEADFFTMLDMEELDGQPGVPTTAAAIEGRPSFIDTGLYANSFRAWVEE